jgi:hypothetical protein
VGFCQIAADFCSIGGKAAWRPRNADYCTITVIGYIEKIVP